MANLKNPLEFELPLVELERQLAGLLDDVAGGAEERRDEYAKLERKVAKKREEIYGRLTPYQRVQLSRHFDRPFTLDYLQLAFSDFVELHGDRLFGDDHAIVGGLARLGPQRVVVVGQQRGRTTGERLQRNFGMAQPEGYRKALRLYHMAEKFKLPIVTLIDTQGAFPGLEAEERGQAEAIARNLIELSLIKTPVVSVVIGEGGSGGALALGVADRILMMENACYSVITPEGCASILWHAKDNEQPQAYAPQAAEALQLTASDLKRNKIIEEIIPEPEGGAHWNPQEAAEALKTCVSRQLDELMALDHDSLLDQRYQKFRMMGVFTENTK